jgi:hypothetical protein
VRERAAALFDEFSNENTGAKLSSLSLSGE